MADSLVLGCTRTDHPMRRRLSESVTVELLLTMEHLNLQLTCTATVMAAYLGTYSAYVEPSGLPWSLGYEQNYRRFARRAPSTTAPPSCTDH
jgi:hypothetical protein